MSTQTVHITYTDGRFEAWPWPEETAHSYVRAMNLRPDVERAWVTQ